MEAVKKTNDYTIFKKRSGRFGVQMTDKKWVNGEEKSKILAKHKLIKLSAPKPKEEKKPAKAEAPAAEESSTEEA